MSNHPRSQQELQAASDHLGYEIWMLGKTAAKLRGMEPGPDRNAVLESFTIHARGIRQFFEPTRPKPDDVLAWHYVGDPVQWQKVRGRMPAALAHIDGRVGSEIVHLSYRRLKFGPVADQWNISAIHEALTRIIHESRPVHHFDGPPEDSAGRAGHRPASGRKGGLLRVLSVA